MRLWSADGADGETLAEEPASVCKTNRIGLPWRATGVRSKRFARATKECFRSPIPKIGGGAGCRPGHDDPG